MPEPLKEKKMCSVCKTKEIKLGIYTPGCPARLMYGFCSKICIANNTIRYYKIKKVSEVIK